MFVRTRIRKLKNGSSSYAYLVDNQWNSIRKKHEQKIIACLGPTVRLPNDGTIEKIIVALDNFARKEGFSALSGGTVIPEIREGRNLTSSFDWGSLILTIQALKNLSLDKIIQGSLSYAFKKEISREKFIAAIVLTLNESEKETMAEFIKNHLGKQKISNRQLWFDLEKLI